MEERLSIDKCRKLIGNSQSYSDKQIEQMRNTLYALAGFVIEKVKAIKDAFISKIQTISCKAFIVK